MSGDQRSEAFAGWRRLFEGLAEQRPLVALFEDLHWADEGLLDFVDYLVYVIFFHVCQPVEHGCPGHFSLKF